MPIVFCSNLGQVISDDIAHLYVPPPGLESVSVYIEIFDFPFRESLLHFFELNSFPRTLGPPLSFEVNF